MALSPEEIHRDLTLDLLWKVVHLEQARDCLWQISRYDNADLPPEKQANRQAVLKLCQGLIESEITKAMKEAYEAFREIYSRATSEGAVPVLPGNDGEVRDSIMAASVTTRVGESHSSADSSAAQSESVETARD